MNRKLFASAAAGTALVATLGIGGLTFAHANTTAAAPVAASATTTAVPAATTVAQKATLKSAVKAKANKQTANKAHKRSPEAAAVHALRQAYDRIAVFQTLPAAKAPAEATQLIEKAKALYSTALADDQAARYGHAAATAQAADHAAAAAIAMVRLQLGPVTVPGLTPPPAGPTDATTTVANLNKEVAKLQKRIANAQQAATKAGSDATFYLTIANNALTQAQHDISTQAFANARLEGRIANDAATVVLDLAHAAAPATPAATATASAQ